MRRFLTRAVQVLAVVVVSAGLVTLPEVATARVAPQTLADRQAVGRTPVQPGFPIDYVGVFWDGELRHDHGTEGAAAPHGAIRFRVDGEWGPWTRLIEDGIESHGRWASGLVSGGGADTYQVRGVPDEAIRPRAVALNTTDGPLVRVGTAAGGAAHAVDSALCRSRAEWGADESLRFEGDQEIWVPEFHDAQVVTVHHTATKNDDPDPAATVRAIYRYHAVDQGWGDIGYQYLVDESGVVYEGRWSGSASTACAAAPDGGGGDGSEFAHEPDTDTDIDTDTDTDRMVTAAHTGGWNSGNLGVALLGEFTDSPRFGGDPKAAAVSSLEDLLAELATRHGLDPTAKVTYLNPVSGDSTYVDTIGGHRDYTATECPGERLYDLLPSIRENVEAQMGSSGDSAPTVVVDSPVDGSTVSGVTTVTATATDESGVTQVEFWIDGVSRGVDTTSSDGWTYSWDTSRDSDGSHTVGAVAVDSAGQTAGHTVTVTVDNVADAPAPTMHVGDLEGTTTTLKNGWRALVTTTVLSDSQPLEGVEVQGSWSTGGTSMCTTGASGACTVTSGSMRKTVSSVTFSIETLLLEGCTYDSTANVDADQDSTGTAITVTRP